MTTTRRQSVPYVELNRHLASLSEQARPVVIQIGNVMRTISRSLRNIRWEEMRQRQALYAARTLTDGRRRHGAVKHARDELRRVRKRTARTYP